MDKIEREIINVILSSPPLKAIEIASNLKDSRQKVEYHLKKLLASKVLIRKDKFYTINFKKLFEIEKLVVISDSDQIKDFIEFSFTQVPGVRGYFIEPWQPMRPNDRERVEFDMMLDRAYNNRNIVYEGIVDNNALEIFKHYPISELQKERERLYVAFGLDKEFILLNHTFYVVGDFVTELDYSKKEIKVQKNQELAKVIEMLVKMSRQFGNRVNIVQTIEEIKRNKQLKNETTSPLL